ncbi:hypothetical protein PILCRDRAFT_818483 [Piloderma croceum F 1598]|uniref:Uncharacterized protein n=1 Tax=Piloderma croceum (strain F 1598) TaxID=765440 RepID=A0A0C3G0I4_PILCF|nr:hypothetical protein PILCRDRAFT_818483 [Piloderma croceum F 1598]
MHYLESEGLWHVNASDAGLESYKQADIFKASTNPITFTLSHTSALCVVTEHL